MSDAPVSLEPQPPERPSRWRLPLALVGLLALVVGVLVGTNLRTPEERAVRSEADGPGGLDAKTAAAFGGGYGDDVRSRLYQACLKQGFRLRVDAVAGRQRPAVRGDAGAASGGEEGR